MGAENRFHSLAVEPIERPLRPHLERMAALLRRRRTGDCPAAGESEARQCRFVIDPARRDLERMRRGVAGIDRADIFQRKIPVEPPEGEPDIAPDPKASPPKEFKAYAPPPIGRPTQRTPEATAPAPADPIPLMNYFHFTNLGSALDVLA